MGELYPRHEKRTKNPAETTGNRYEIEILMSRTQKLKGLVAASLRVKNIKRQSLFIPRFCPEKRQSTGQVATSEYHSRRASPENNKKKRVRYDIT